MNGSDSYETTVENCSSFSYQHQQNDGKTTHSQQVIIGTFSIVLSILAVIFNTIVGLLMYKQRIYRKKSSWSTLILITSEWFVAFTVMIVLVWRLKQNHTTCDEQGGSALNTPTLITFTIILETIPTGVLLFTAHDRYVRLKDLINYSSNFNTQRFWMQYCCCLFHSVILGVFFLSLPDYAVVIPWFLIIYFLSVSVYGCILCFKSYQITQIHVHEYSTLLLNKLRKLMRLHVQQMIFLFFCYTLRVLVLAFSLTNILPLLSDSVLFYTSIMVTPLISLLNALTLIFMDPYASKLIHDLFCKRTREIAPSAPANHPQNGIVGGQIGPPAVLLSVRRNKLSEHIQQIQQQRRVIRFWTETDAWSMAPSVDGSFRIVKSLQLSLNQKN